MGVITRLAEEVVNMGDLAQAIVSLGRIAERRRGARTDLIEATDTIAAAIREELRTGDMVEVERHAQELLSGLIFAPGKATYRATRVTINAAAKPIDVLARIVDGKAALFGEGLGRTSGVRLDLLAQQRVPLGAIETDEGVDVHVATEEERQAFVQEASAVVSAFRRLLEQQASDYEAAAKKAAKLTPR
jgi:hypothetical protein